MNQYPNEMLADASPSTFDSYNDDLKTTVQVLKAEAADRSGWSAELLDAAAEFIRHEVKG